MAIKKSARLHQPLQRTNAAYPTFSTEGMRRMAAKGQGEQYAVLREAERMSATKTEADAQLVTPPHVVTIDDVTRGLGLDAGEEQRVQHVVGETNARFDGQGQPRIHLAQKNLVSVFRELKYPAALRRALAKRALAYLRNTQRTDYGRAPIRREQLEVGKKSLFAFVQDLRKSPFIGPRGGLYADSALKIPYSKAKHGKVNPKGCPRCKGLAHIIAQQTTTDGNSEATSSPCRTCNPKGKIGLDPKKVKAAGKPMPSANNRSNKPPKQPRKPAPQQTNFNFNKPQQQSLFRSENVHIFNFVFKKAMYLGPRGGKYMDAALTIPYHESEAKRAELRSAEKKKARREKREPAAWAVASQPSAEPKKEPAKKEPAKKEPAKKEPAKKEPAKKEPAKTAKNGHRMAHQPSKHTPSHKMPADVFKHASDYTGFPEQLREFLPQLKAAQGDPNAKITIYRALPKDAKSFATGDWVTLSSTYAQQHADSRKEGGVKHEWRVAKVEVPLKDLYWAGDDLAEWGYYGEGLNKAQVSMMKTEIEQSMRKGLSKAAAQGGKYYKRVATGKPKRPWRYFYTKAAYDKEHGGNHVSGPSTKRSRAIKGLKKAMSGKTTLKNAHGEVIPRKEAQRIWVKGTDFGLPAQTVDKYAKKSGKDKYGEAKLVFTPDRQQLHDELVAGATGHVPVVPADKQPVAVVMMGGGGSGKGTVLKAILHNEHDFVHVDSDEFKKKIPEYKEAMEITNITGLPVTAKDAAWMAHEESSHIAEAALQAGISNRQNVIMDGTGKNAKKHAAKIEQMKALGYQVQLVYAHADMDSAVTRAAGRADRTGRYVPLDVLEDAHTKIPGNFEYVAAHADEFKVLISQPPPIPPIKLWDGPPDVIHDPARVAQFKTVAAELHAKAGIKLPPPPPRPVAKSASEDALFTMVALRKSARASVSSEELAARIERNAQHYSWEDTDENVTEGSEDLLRAAAATVRKGPAFA